MCFGGFRLSVEFGWVVGGVIVSVGFDLCGLILLDLVFVSF